MTTKESKTHAVLNHLWKRYRALHLLDLWLVTVLLVAALVYVVSRISIAKATGGHVLPVDANDWAAWGTWIGGLATTAAFIFTALQIRMQRANRIADEVKAFNELKNKSRLVFPRISGALRYGGFVGYPTHNPSANSQLVGHEYLLTVTNGNNTAVSVVSIGFNDHFALAPSISAAQPTWKMGENRGVPISSDLNVPSLPLNVSASGVSNGWAMAVLCDVVQPGKALCFKLVFRSAPEVLTPTWIKFTDSTGFTWFRDLRTDEIIYIP